MSRCLICSRVNPCPDHDYDRQDAELDRNKRAIAELQSIHQPIHPQPESRAAEAVVVAESIQRCTECGDPDCNGQCMEGGDRG